MAIDRAAALRNAEKLLRQGKPDAAIAEYRRVVDDQPRDWNTANLLGDLYVRGGQMEMAIDQFVRIADGLSDEGFLQKAGALYKKVLKLRPDHEHALLQAAQLAATQGLLADARLYLNDVLNRRRGRGDAAGAAEVSVRLGALDPSDFAARMAGARARLELDDKPGALRDLKSLASELTEKGRGAEAAEALRAASALDPVDEEVRARLLDVHVAAGDFVRAREYATTAEQVRALAERQLRGDHPEEGLALLRQLLGEHADQRDAIALAGWTIAAERVDVGFKVVELVADAAVTATDWPAAAAVLQEFITRVPNHIPALLRLVEVCVDGGLDATTSSAQAQLADAYLVAGAAWEARFIAEDLVTREPWEKANIERLRQALVLVGESDPDAVIADRLSSPSPSSELSLDVPDTRYVPAAGPDSPDPPDPPDLQEPLHAGAQSSVWPSEVSPVEMPAVEAPRQKEWPPRPSEGRHHFELSVNAIDLAGFLAELETPPAPVHMGPDSVEVDLSIDLNGVGRSTSFPAPAIPPTDPRPIDPVSPPVPDSLDSVFDGFRGQAQRTRADAAEGLYKHALALRDAGDIDGCLQALQDASRAPQLRFAAASLVGRLLRREGRMSQATEWLERAAQVPAPSPEELHELLYELGETLEASGEGARALAVLLELQADVGEYRDIAARIDRLTKTQDQG